MAVPRTVSWRVSVLSILTFPICSGIIEKEIAESPTCFVPNIYFWKGLFKQQDKDWQTGTGVEEGGISG